MLKLDIHKIDKAFEAKENMRYILIMIHFPASSIYFSVNKKYIFIRRK